MEPRKRLVQILSPIMDAQESSGPTYDAIDLINALEELIDQRIEKALADKKREGP